MDEQQSFADLLRRIRRGDEDAAAEIVRLYEPEIRREVRLRLGDPRLRRVFDSMDICQSVLASFFLRMNTGQYDLGQPEQLLKLLLAMTRNKVAFAARTQRAQCRDHRRVTGGHRLEREAIAGGPSPSQVVADEELIGEFRKRLSEEERRLAELRAHGQEWIEIAAQLGGTAEGRRKQLARAIERVSQQLGLQDLRGE